MAAVRSPWSGRVSALWILSCYIPTSEPSGFASWLLRLLKFYGRTQCLLVLACILFHLPAGGFTWRPEADPLTVICSSLLWGLGEWFTVAWPLLLLTRSPAFTKAQISFKGQRMKIILVFDVYLHMHLTYLEEDKEELLPKQI